MHTAKRACREVNAVLNNKSSQSAAVNLPRSECITKKHNTMLTGMPDEQSIERMRAQIAVLAKPAIQLVLSGKRKCGKDYLERIFLEQYPNLVLSYRISAPIKGAFARANGLDLSELLSDSPYKEQYRARMVTWSESVRAADPHHFIRLSIVEEYARMREQSQSPKPIWILNDARRITDLQYFSDSNEIDMCKTKLITVRVTSTEQTRTSRGWIFTPGIDDQTTECGCDGVDDWNFRICNDGTKQDLLNQLKPIFEIIDSRLSR